MYVCTHHVYINTSKLQPSHSLVNKFFRLIQITGKIEKKFVKRGTCSSCVHLLNAEETTSRSESNQIKSNPTSLCGCRSLKNSFLFRYHCYRGPLPFPSHPIPPYSGRLDKKHSFLFEYSAQWDKGNRFLLSSWIRNACMF